ncbi:recombinase family protein [Sphingomonas sp. CFBP 13714]|uniref:recombinase family protein n=1 Tax=Sphingomonas sp. CFBP 13714 TaxID=2775308 RepID=UPI00177F1DD6|nr:recombinase family protein [Sphingomonas sp. CFBP 13714]MBD8699305.1 recombinase family protein [Sphingomonas sp. CFBP 13714]
MTDTPRPKAYRYHRFSTPEQDSGTSLDRQRKATKDLCKVKEWQDVEVIEDKGLSAWKGDHLRVGGLGRFTDRVAAGEIDPGSILVIENLDRLSREKLRKARRWIEDVNDAGITVAVCKPELLLDEAAMSGSNMGTMVLYLMEAGRGSGESDRKSDLLLAAQEERMAKARNGIVYTNRMPAWLIGERDGKFEVNEERAQVVRDIYTWCADGLGFQAIAKLLNDTVEPWTKPHRKSHATWKPGYIRDILTKPVVEGEYHRRTGDSRKLTGEVIDYYPRVVPTELVAKARAALRDRSTTGPNHHEARNLFSGLLKCGHCGDTMVRVVSRAAGKEYEHLKCIRYNNAGSPVEGDPNEKNARRCINGTYYRYDAFERAALNQILHLALDNTYFTRADLTAPLVVEVAQLTKDLEVMQAKQRRYMTWIEEDDEATEAKDMLREMRPALADVRLKLDQAKLGLERARGNVTPEEHLRRVVEVKDAIYSEDDETRQSARRKVAEAVRSVVSVATFRRQYVEGKRTPVREAQLALAGGALAYRFDNDGNMIGSPVNFGSAMDQFGSTNTGAEDVMPAIRRRALSKL